MERKGLIALALALGLVALVLIVLAGGDDAPSDPPPRIGTTRSEGSASPGGSVGNGSSGGVPSVRARAARGDGGVRPPPLAPRTPVPRLPEGSPRAVPPVRTDSVRAAEDTENRTSGWRLGLTRGRIQVVEDRLAQLRAGLATFEASGDTAAAERQRTVIQRFENRLDELHEQETSLAAQALADGTAGDEASGRDAAQTEAQRTRPPIRAAERQR